MSDEIVGAALRNWTVADDFPEDLKFCVEAMARWDIVIFVDGSIRDRELGVGIRRNHLICMLRRQYLDESWGGFRGRTLGTRINILLDHIIKCIRDRLTEPRSNRDVLPMRVGGGFI